MVQTTASFTTHGNNPPVLPHEDDQYHCVSLIRASNFQKKHNQSAKNEGFGGAMVLATMLNHPFSSPKRCATDNIAIQPYEAMPSWFIVAWVWLMRAHRFQKRSRRQRAKPSNRLVTTISRRETNTQQYPVTICSTTM